MAHRGRVPVSIVNPARVRAFAKARGQRAKTDRIDATLITQRVAWINLLERAAEAVLQKLHRKHLRQTDTSMAAVEKQISATLCSPIRPWPPATSA